LAQIGEITPNENIHITKAHMESDMLQPMREDVLKSLHLVPYVKQVPNFDEGREDVSFMDIITIDDPSTDEVDDGLSVETLADNTEWIHIHIADPTRLFDPNSELDLEARRRVTSVYLPEKKVSMLPHSVASGVMSILDTEKNHGVKNYMLTFSCRLAPNGSIQEYKIFPSFSKNVKRASYQEVDAFFESAINQTIFSNSIGKFTEVAEMGSTPQPLQM